MLLKHPCPISPLKYSHVNVNLMKNLRLSLLFLIITLRCMSNLDFKKWQCRHVEFKGQGPISTVVLRMEVREGTHRPCMSIPTYGSND